MRTIPRSFGHPAIKMTEALLRLPQGTEMNHDTKTAIWRIAGNLKTFTIYANTSRRFKLAIGTTELRFKSIVLVDTMFLNK